MKRCGGCNRRKRDNLFKPDVFLLFYRGWTEYRPCCFACYKKLPPETWID